MDAKMVRDIPDLLESLRRHTSLLRSYFAKVFEESDYTYCGEIAGKLRLLVYEHGRNIPLLLALLDEFQIHIPVTIGDLACCPGEPQEGDHTSLRGFLSLTAYEFITESPAGVRRIKLSRMDVISLWAQKCGSAHEDWEFSSDWNILLTSEYMSREWTALNYLREVAEIVLKTADEFLRVLTPEMISLVDAQRLQKFRLLKKPFIYGFLWYFT